MTGPHGLFGGYLGKISFSKWAVLQIRVPFRVLVLRVPYYVGDPRKAPQFRLTTQVYFPRLHGSSRCMLHGVNDSSAPVQSSRGSES